ncbi:hypothetical protein [Noviluteimonas dokdonensis]|uniref:hypothetical protein n=1 Tax=Noviluteimonas dokdonensis TaxID=414050 RepID=UPI001269EFAB|nr:hypothetical protein [Lysobacter dokdonensis]
MNRQTVAGTKRRTLIACLGCLLSLVVACLILWSQSARISSGEFSTLAWVGLVMCVGGLASMACYSLYLGVNSLVSGLFPAPNAHVPCAWKVVTGHKGRISGVLMIVSGLLVGTLAVLAVVVVWPPSGVTKARVTQDFRMHPPPGRRYAGVRLVQRTHISANRQDFDVRYCKHEQETEACKDKAVSMTYVRLPDGSWMMASMSGEQAP